MFVTQNKNFIHHKTHSLLFFTFLQHMKYLVETKLIMEWSGEMRKLICLQRNLNKNKPVNCYITLENNKKDTTAYKTNTKCIMPLI